MPKRDLEPKIIRNFVNGIVHEDIVGDFLQPESSVNEAINMSFDTMGSAKTRLGTTLLGNQIASGTDILGMHQFLDQGSGTDDQIVVVNQSSVYYLSGSTWTSIRSGLSAAKARFTNFTDRIMMANGADSTLGWNGSGDSGSFDSTNLVSAPSGNFIDNFRSRVWIANTPSNPSRLFYSTAVSSAGAITWNTTTQFIDISPGDGEDITGLKRSPRALLVFKPNHIYRVFGIDETDPDPQINVGTYSQESVVEAKDGYYFHDFTNSAIQKYTGGTPIEISKPIKPYLEGVSLSERANVAGWKDADHIYQSVGDITLNGVTFSNVVFVYTISTQIWTIYSYPTQPLVGTLYDDGSTLEPIIGDDDGNILTFNNGNTDNTVPITYSLVTKWYDLSGLRSYTETISQLGALHRNIQGGLLQYQVNTPNTESDWEPIGEIQDPTVHLFDTDITGHKVRFRLSGTSTGEEAIFEGIEIIKSFSEFTVD